MAGPLMLAGTMMTAGATIAHGSIQSEMATLQARQLRDQAVAAEAESVIIAKGERKKAELLSSRAKALAAASGTGMDSPNTINTLADIDERGAYNALAALYTGKTSSRSKRIASAFKDVESSNIKLQSFMDAGSTVLSGIDAWKRYG